jgi:hypothetical protein
MAGRDLAQSAGVRLDRRRRGIRRHSRPYLRAISRKLASGLGTMQGRGHHGPLGRRAPGIAASGPVAGDATAGAVFIS